MTGALTLIYLATLPAAVAPAQPDPTLPLAPRPITTRPAAEGNDLSQAIEQASRRVVKLYGATAGREHGYGTGVVVSPDGRVVTVWALLLESSQLRAVTADGHVYPARVLHRDAYRQLAVLQLARYPENVDTQASVRDQMKPIDLETFTPGSSTSLRAGDFVLAVGNVFKVADGDEPVSVLKGIVSGKTPLDAERGPKPFPYRGEVILIDAITASPGMPGAPLIDLDGRWVGLIGKMVTSRATNTYLNYAYSIEEIKAVIQDAEHPAQAASRPAAAYRGKGYHGIKLSKIAYRRRLPFVRSVTRGSPAAEAGVKSDDLIVSANGVAIPRARAFTELLGRLAPGDALSLIVKRGDQLVTLRLTLEEPSE